MSCDKDKIRTPPPMDDEEFDAWWPFNDDELDEFEREIEESISGYELLPDPDWEERKRHIEETARRTLAKEHPGQITEEMRKLLPPGLLAYWRGEAPTPYTDPTGWDEIRKSQPLPEDLWRWVPIDKPADAEPQGQAVADDDA